MTVLGSVLHSFYNGLENIFIIIAKNIDKNVPIGNKSHQELLQQMATSSNAREKYLMKKFIWNCVNMLHLGIFIGMPIRFN